MNFKNDSSKYDLANFTMKKYKGNDTFNKAKKVNINQWTDSQKFLRIVCNQELDSKSSYIDTKFSQKFLEDLGTTSKYAPKNFFLNSQQLSQDVVPSKDTILGNSQNFKSVEAGQHIMDKLEKRASEIRKGSFDNTMNKHA